MVNFKCANRLVPGRHTETYIGVLIETGNHIKVNLIQLMIRNILQA